MSKKRPALVVSSDAVGILPIKLVAPITGWQVKFERCPWLVLIEPDEINGLTKNSAVDTLQLRGLDTSRFIACIGRITADEMEEVALSIGVVVEVP